MTGVNFIVSFRYFCSDRNIRRNRRFVKSPPRGLGRPVAKRLAIAENCPFPQQPRPVMPTRKPFALPALDPAAVKPRTGNSYPEPFGRAAAAREKRVLGDAAGLKNFGVNLVRLPPGTTSSQRHWHTHEDEFVYIVEGEVELVTDSGGQTLTAGMCAGFPAGGRDGHHLVNRSARDAVYLEVGDRKEEDQCSYSDVDLHYGPSARDGKFGFTRKNGEPY